MDYCIRRLTAWAGRPRLYVCLELDGVQHFDPTYRLRVFGVPGRDERQIDIRKMLLCLQHGYSVVRLRSARISMTSPDAVGSWLTHQMARPFCSDASSPHVVLPRESEYEPVARDLQAADPSVHILFVDPL